MTAARQFINLLRRAFLCARSSQKDRANPSRSARAVLDVTARAPSRRSPTSAIVDAIQLRASAEDALRTRLCAAIAQDLARREALVEFARRETRIVECRADALAQVVAHDREQRAALACCIKTFKTSYHSMEPR